jgi:hypothetical protein
MSVVRGFGLNGKSIYVNVAKPIEVYCNFIVDAANGNGLGMRSLKSNGFVEAAFMHTSSTPGKSPGGILNPNPAVGYIEMIFKNNFNYYLGGFSGQITPVTSASTTSVTNHSVYVITSLGTTTLAQWNAVGVRPGLTPAVGMSFVATATQAIGGTGTVGLPGEQIAPIVSVVGDPNVSLNNSSVAANAGAQVLLQVSGPTAAGNTALIPVAPADGTVVGLEFSFDGSSVTIDGL